MCGGSDRLLQNTRVRSRRCSTLRRSLSQVSQATRSPDVQGFDREPIAEIATDDAAVLEAKLVAASRASVTVMAGQSRRAHPVLRRLAALVEHRRNHFAQQIAREGGKPLSDAIVEVSRAIDGVLNAAEELRTFAGLEIPMGLTLASTDRWAFTTKEPLGCGASWASTIRSI